MKDQAVRLQAILFVLLIIVIPALITGYKALNLLKETKSYLDNQRIPLVLPGGGVKF